MTTRALPGFPGYLVTSDGRVLGKDGRALRAQPNRRTGHLRVRLYTPTSTPRATARGGSIRWSRYTNVYVHVAVCTAFHGPRPHPDDLVLHWDDDPHNNRAENLRWGSRSQNEQDKRRNREDPTPVPEPVDCDGFDWSLGEQVPA